jgi:uncharacterized protein YggT (Ycf19 family)
MLAFAGGLVLWWRFRNIYVGVLTGLLVVLALLAWVAPARHAPVQRFFDELTRLLVAGFSWLMLGALYFGLFTPLHWVGALMGRDPLHQKPDRSAPTYLRELPPAPAGRFGRQF